jgi:hypothetical protein
VGRLLVGGGPVAAAGALAPEQFAFALVLAPALAAAAVTLGYSYWRYQQV